MTEWRTVLLVLGFFITMLGLAMVFPMWADLTHSNDWHRANWKSFGISSALCIFMGAGLVLANWGKVETLTLRQGFLISGLSWIVICAFAAMPFVLGQYHLSWTDAWFETVSGITTTGSTVVTGLDDAPYGLLLWRSMLQWFGGVGIVIMAIAVLPMLSIGGMQLFRMQSSDTTEKVFADTSKIALGLTLLYTFITLACFAGYWLMGMNAFDAINHAMTTIATGGSSTKDASFGYFLSDPSIHGPIDLVADFFMIISSMPFGLFLLALRKNFNVVWNDAQVRFYITLIAIFIIAMTIKVFALYNYHLPTALRQASFNVISVMSGTGYASTDYGLWGPFAVGMFFCAMFIGGCAGSASCGLKVFRFQVALSALWTYGQKLVYPNGVFVAHYNGRPLTTDVYISVLSFFFVYFVTYATAAVILSLLNLDAVTALSAAGSALANVGPGLGDIVGPSGNYQALPDAAKWTLSITMLLGRLEFFTLLVMLAPSFWRE